MALLNRCPSCGSDQVSRYRPLGCIFVVICLLTFGIGLLLYPFLPKECLCKACGAKWKP